MQLCLIYRYCTCTTPKKKQLGFFFWGGGWFQAQSFISGNLEKFLKGGGGLQGVVALTVSRDNSIKMSNFVNHRVPEKGCSIHDIFRIKFYNRNGGGFTPHCTITINSLQTCLLACNEVMNKDVTNSIQMYNG